MSPEAAFFQAFVEPARRQRYLELLGTTPGRETVRASLDHFKDLDSRFCERIVTAEQNPAEILRKLTAAGAPALCQIMSSDRTLDGRKLPLSGALREVIGRGAGTIIFCLPGMLAFFESEEPGERYICRRDKTFQRG